MYSTIGTLHGLSLVDGPSVSTSRCIKRHRYWYVTKMSDFSPFYYYFFFPSTLSTSIYLILIFISLEKLHDAAIKKKRESTCLFHTGISIHGKRVGRVFCHFGTTTTKKKYKTTTKKPKKKFKIKTNTKGWTAFNKLAVIIPPPICSCKHRTTRWLRSSTHPVFSISFTMFGNKLLLRNGWKIPFT